MLSVRCLSVLSVLSVCGVGVLWPNGWMDQDETWHWCRPRSRSHCVRWEPSSTAPLLRKGAQTHFLAHVCCGQTARSIKMPLGTEEGLGPGHIVLAIYPQKGGSSPHFSAHVLWPNGWIDQDATWYGGRPRPRWHCVRWGPAPPLKRDTAPTFRPISIVAKRLDGSRCHLVRPRPHCVRWGPICPRKGRSPPFSADVYCGQTVSHL